jgi:hypothetical protein
MQHPDEGTIHAYLDDALPPAEAREVEAHIASCEACQGSVAAARGLIAASSRIVSHLDAVPRGVIPAKAPRKSRWIFSAWPAAIAATLVIGIGLASIRGKEDPVLPLPPASTPGIIRSTAPESMPVARPRADEPAPQRQAVPRRAADRAASQSVANEAAAPTVQLPPANATTQKRVVSPPPPSAAPRPDSNKRSGLALEAVVVTGAPPSGRSLAKVGGGAAGMAAGAAAPPAAAVADSRMASERPSRPDSDDAKAFVGCYETVEAPTRAPSSRAETARGYAAEERYDRFALVDEPAPTPGQLAIRTLDPAGRPAAIIFGAGWSVQGDRATLRDSKGQVVLTLARTDSGVRSSTVRVISCK